MDILRQLQYWSIHFEAPGVCAYSSFKDLFQIAPANHVEFWNMFYIHRSLNQTLVDLQNWFQKGVSTMFLTCPSFYSFGNTRSFPLYHMESLEKKNFEHQ